MFMTPSNSRVFNIRGDPGITPLLWLIMQKDTDAVELALQLGADANFPAMVSINRDGPKPAQPLSIIAGERSPVLAVDFLRLQTIYSVAQRLGASFEAFNIDNIFWIALIDSVAFTKIQKVNELIQRVTLNK